MKTKKRMSLLDKLLRKEEIKRGDGKIYLNRWTIFRGRNRLWKYIGLYDIRIYVHQFTAGDGTQCLHDHPNTLRGFIFWNGYVEYVYNPKTKQEERHEIKAPLLRKFAAQHTHRVELLNNKPGWSIIMMSPKERQWGFYTTEGGRRRWFKWDEYEDKFGGVGGCGKNV